MSESTADRLSRELATARRWATTLAGRVWQLEDAIDEHRQLVRTTAWADEQLYAAREEDL